MAHPADVARGRNIVARWCNLAERRLEYLTELFETGRWRRFHTELEFLENIQEAKAAVETWRGLSRAPAAGTDGAVVSRQSGRIETMRPSAGPQPEIPLAEARLVPIEDVPSAPVDLAALERTLTEMLAPALDIGTIERRYPLLHNAL